MRSCREVPGSQGLTKYWYRKDRSVEDWAVDRRHKIFHEPPRAVYLCMHVLAIADKTT